MKTILLAVLAAATSVAAGVALAASSGAASDTIFACTHPSGGWLRQVSESTQCRRRETPVSWNIAGPKGDSGEPGAQGPKGDKGDPGTAITGLKTLEGVPCVAEDSAAGYAPNPNSRLSDEDLKKAVTMFGPGQSAVLLVSPKPAVSELERSLGMGAQSNAQIMELEVKQ